MGHVSYSQTHRQISANVYVMVISNLCVWSYQREKVILQAQTIYREQRKISDSWQQTLQHGRAVLDPVEAYRAWIKLQQEKETFLTRLLISG